MKKQSPRFSPATIKFLKRALNQKNPAWLERNYDEYESLLRAPLTHLAETAKQALQPLAPGYHFPQKGLGRLKRQSHRPGERGGGVFKDWVTYSASRPRTSRFENNPNLFFMIDSTDPDDYVLVAGGLYMPSSKQLRAIREAIARDSSEFEELFETKEFARRFRGGFSPEKIATRPPRGFDPNHPKMNWLKLQAFFVWRGYTMKEFSSANFATIVTSDFKQILRLNVLLEKAIAGAQRPSQRVEVRNKGGVLKQLEDLEAPRRQMDF